MYCKKKIFADKLFNAVGDFAIPRILIFAADAGTQLSSFIVLLSYTCISYSNSDWIQLFSRTGCQLQKKKKKKKKKKAKIVGPPGEKKHSFYST